MPFFLTERKEKRLSRRAESVGRLSVASYGKESRTGGVPWR